MKYVILDHKGHKLPVIFPEALNHDLVAAAMKVVIMTQIKQGSTTIYGAGFCDPITVAVHGKSESLGIESKPADLPYIALGASIAHMPPDDALLLFTQLRKDVAKTTFKEPE